MPDGRFISKTIAHSEQLAGVSLNADYLFARCLPHLDREGRMTGNPQLIKAVAVPLRVEITAETIPLLLGELVAAELVTWYAVDGKQVLQFPGFAGHQKGMKKDREAPSRYPAPDDPAAAPLGPDSCESPAEVLQRSGVAAAKVDISEVEVEVEVKSKKSTKGASPSARADKAAPWMADIRPIYRERYDADPPAQTVKALRPLVTKHGEQAVAVRFRVYCERTEGRFFDPFRFAATWGEWTPNGSSAPARASPLADEYAAFDDLLRVVNAAGGYARLTSEWHAAQSEPVRRAISAIGGLKSVANSDEIGLRIKRKIFAEALSAAATAAPPREATA